MTNLFTHLQLKCVVPLKPVTKNMLAHTGTYQDAEENMKVISLEL